MKEAAENKRAWVRRYLGDHVEVRCCRAREKCLHAAPGDILIDDWTKYRHLWINAGGRRITHVIAVDTGRQLTELIQVSDCVFSSTAIRALCK